MRSAVRICPAAPKRPEIARFWGVFVCFGVSDKTNSGFRGKARYGKMHLKLTESVRDHEVCNGT